MGDRFYAQEKLSHAVYLLATGRGNIKQRLCDAFTEFAPVCADDLPSQFRDEFTWMRNQLTSKEAKQRAVVEGKVVVGFEGRIGATLRTMRYERAEEIAKRLTRLADQLAEYNAAA